MVIIDAMHSSDLVRDPRTGELVRDPLADPARNDGQRELFFDAKRLSFHYTPGHLRDLVQQGLYQPGRPVPEPFINGYRRPFGIGIDTGELSTEFSGTYPVRGA